MSKNKKEGPTVAFPSKKLMKDIKEILEQHGWSEGAISIQKHSKTDNGGGGVENALLTNLPKTTAADEIECTPPTKPTKVTVHLPDGTLVTKIVCL